MFTRSAKKLTDSELDLLTETNFDFDQPILENCQNGTFLPVDFGGPKK